MNFETAYLYCFKKECDPETAVSGAELEPDDPVNEMMRHDQRQAALWSRRQ